MLKLSQLAVVILNYNSADLTMKCADQLNSFGVDFHIIIVDNNSIDNSFDILKGRYKNSNIVVLGLTTNSGYSAGNNYGIQYAIREYGIQYFAIVNPDVIIPSLEVIEKMIGTIEKADKCAIIGASAIVKDNIYSSSFSAWHIPGKIEFIISRSIILKRLFPKKIEEWKLYSEKVAEVECVTGCFFIGSVEIMKKIGFLDEDIFMYNEEILLGYKLKKSGYQELLQLDQFYYHNHQMKPSPTIVSYIPARKKRFHSDIVLYNKIYRGKIGFTIMYLLEIINCIILFPWFGFKQLLHRRNLHENS